MQQPYPAPQPKKGLSTLAIILIALGSVAVLMLGTCAVGALWLNKEVKQLGAEMGDGAWVTESPPAVKSELAGPKKDYVGSWTGGGTALTIAADGRLSFHKGDYGVASEDITAGIADFAGDDIHVQSGITITIKVTSPPKLVGDHWEMTADGVKLRRKAP